MRNHPSSDEVFSAIHDRYPSIGRATVYRVLNRLAEKGEIQKINIPNTADRFDFRTDTHIHLRCTECGRVLDGDFDEAADLLRHVDRVLHTDQTETLLGFEMRGVSLCFDGLCQDCRRKHETDE